jgi:recombinational DNA repair protein RecR
MASKEQLRKIAIYCDSYNTREDTSLQSSSDVYEEKYESCENCSHFTKDGKCDIDLIDKVLSSLAMELDLKR